MIDKLYGIRNNLKDLGYNMYFKDYKVTSIDLEVIYDAVNILIDKIHSIDKEIDFIESTTDERLTLSRCNIIKEIIGGIKEDGKETK